MKKEMLVSLVNMGLKAANHEVSPPVEEMPVYMLETSLQTSLEHLAEEVPAMRDRLEHLETQEAIHEAKISEARDDVAGRFTHDIEDLRAELHAWKIKHREAAELNQKYRQEILGLQEELAALKEDNQTEETTPTPQELPEIDEEASKKEFIYRLGIRPESALWDHVIIRQTHPTRFTVLFPVEFYRENKDSCFGFLARLQLLARKKKLRQHFKPGCLALWVEARK